MTKEYTCCFFGHRKISISEKQINQVKTTIEKLITENMVNTFLFGSKSEFDALCLKIVTELKNKYPHVKRIYVRAVYPYIEENYMKFILKKYDETFFPEKILNAGKASYVERNYEMINKSNYCIVFYDEDYMPPRRKRSKKEIFDYQPVSGTRIAFEYAVKKKKIIFNIANN